MLRHRFLLSLAASLKYKQLLEVVVGIGWNPHWMRRLGGEVAVVRLNGSEGN